MTTKASGHEYLALVEKLVKMMMYLSYDGYIYWVNGTAVISGINVNSSVPNN